MSFAPQTTDAEQEPQLEETPAVDTREWGTYGTVLIEEDNTGGWIMAEDEDTLINMDEMR